MTVKSVKNVKGHVKMLVEKLLYCFTNICYKSMYYQHIALYCQDGRTALHYAALNGFTDVTRFLVDKGCDINIQDDVSLLAQNSLN